MNDSERRKQEAFVRSHGFGVAHATDFAEGSRGPMVDFAPAKSEVRTRRAAP